MTGFHGASNEKITLLRGCSIFHRCILPLKDRVRNVVSSLQFTFPSYIFSREKTRGVSFDSHFRLPERERVLLTMHYTNAKGRAKDERRKRRKDREEEKILNEYI